jgi:hypothetical protein
MFHSLTSLVQAFHGMQENPLLFMTRYERSYLYLIFIPPGVLRM